MISALVFSWVGFAVLVVLIALGWTLYWRRAKHWAPTKPSTPEAQQAEARLWSKRQNEQTGGLG
jgi:uncharacterized iron-regulated membrane protein